MYLDNDHAHPRDVEWDDLILHERLSGTVREVSVPGSGSRKWERIRMVAKVAAREGDIERIEREIRAYHVLKGTRATPQLEGYVREDGRVIGFLTRKAEVVTPTEWNDQCRWLALLRAMHWSGLGHGNPTLENLLLDGEKREAAEGGCGGLFQVSVWADCGREAAG